MSQATAGAGGMDAGSAYQPEPHVAARDQVHLEDVTFRKGAGTKLGAALIVLGGLLGLVTVVYGLGAGRGAQALAAWHVGAIFALGLSLGALGWVMIMHQFNAGWSTTLRRQAENLASLMWVPLVLLLPTFIFAGSLFKWMDPSYVQHDVLYDHKAIYLTPWFDAWFVPGFYPRAAVYFAVWIFLARSMYRNSIKQDETGDRWLTSSSRKRSAWGLLAFSLTTAFAGFDWLMTLDFHWFSTMFGVYFFAGSFLSVSALLVVVFAALKSAGKLGNAVTEEHFHDMGKLLLSFTVFWAYISFSQYFLIWYGNIPEETGFYTLRDTYYEWLFYLLCFGHFLVPFVILLFRDVKRSPKLLGAIAVWMLIMHALDLYFIVRPTIKDQAFPSHALLDVMGMLAPICLFLGVAVIKIASSGVPLIPLKDPRLHEALEHKNYV